LRHLRLRSPVNPVRKRVRHERRYVVPRGASLRAVGGEGSVLPHQSEGNHEKDNERQPFEHRVPEQFVEKGS